MQDKPIVVGKPYKLNHVALCVLLVYIIIECFIPLPRGLTHCITILCSSVFYITMLHDFKCRHGKVHPVLGLLCIVSIMGVVSRAFYTSPFWDFLIVTCFYLYSIVFQKLMHGKASRKILILAVLFLTGNFTGAFLKQGIGAFFLIGAQVLILCCILDPIMYGIASNHKMRRTAEGDNGLSVIMKKEQKVSMFRKLLFGSTGKLQLSIIRNKS